MNSESVFSAGIFGTEGGQRFLFILMKLADRGFRGLYEKCSSNLSGSYYQQGLRRVSAWSESVIKEDLEIVASECPDMQDTYDDCFSEYVKSRFHKKQASHNCPPFSTFTRAFLESLGRHESLCSGEYFSKRDTVLIRIACMDSARQALYTLVTAENVNIELASEVGSVARSDTRKYSGAASTPPLVVNNREVVMEGEEEEEFEEVPDVLPSDSISQVGIPSQGKRELSPKHARSEVSAVSRGSAKIPPSTVVSRHDFPVEAERGEQRTPTLKSHGEAVSRKNSLTASSRDSSVSIRMRSVKSPVVER